MFAFLDLVLAIASLFSSYFPFSFHLSAFWSWCGVGVGGRGAGVCLCLACVGLGLAGDGERGVEVFAGGVHGDFGAFLLLCFY